MGWYTTTCLVRDLTLKFNRVSSHMVYSIEKQFSELRERERERERDNGVNWQECRVFRQRAR